MKILAIDSSGLTASVALVEEQCTLAEFTTNNRKTHSQTLLPMIDDMLRMAEVELSEIGAIAVAGGPGSFTGLRIGAATAKGLGLALDKPLLHIPTVDALAYQLYGCQDLICPLLDARRKQVYTGVYTFVRQTLSGEEMSQKDTLDFQILHQQAAMPLDQLLSYLNGCGRPVVFLGDGVPVYAELLRAGLTVPFTFAPPCGNRQRAAAVGCLGHLYYRKGCCEPAAYFKPEYLRLPQAERERLEKQAVCVKPMHFQDLETVLSLEKQIFSDAWSRGGLEETLQNPQTICLVAEKDGLPVGYLFVYGTKEQADVARIGVAPGLRRQKIGTKLLKKLQEICQQKAMERIFLEVRESNQGARAFYENLGFQQDNIRKDFYQYPTENAVLMSLSLSRSGEGEEKI